MYQELTTTTESKFAIWDTGIWSSVAEFDKNSTDDSKRDILDEEIITTEPTYRTKVDLNNSVVETLQNHHSSIFAEVSSLMCEKSHFFERAFATKQNLTKRKSLNSWLFNAFEYALPELITFTDVFHKTIKNIYKPYSFLNYEHLFGDLEKIVRSLYAFADFEKVNTNIRESAGLQFLLIETFYKLQEYFGDNAEFVLDYQTDEFDNGSKQLFIRVSSQMTLEKSLDKLDSFESDWYIERTAYILDSPVVTLTQ